MDINIELEEMRQQVSLLKEKLDRQELVNDKMLRKTMKTKISSLKVQQYTEYFSALFVITIGSVIFKAMGCSWSFVIGTILYMSVCAVATFIMHRNLNRDDTANGDLLTVAKHAKKLKKDYHDWFYFAIPSIILWLAWFGYEQYQIYNDMKMALGVFIGALIGGAIGGTIGLLMHRKAKNTLNDIIEQIEE